MAGFSASNNLNLNPNTGLPYYNPNPSNNSLRNQYNVYNAGVKTNAEDYSGIMEGYRNLLANPNRASNQFTPYIPTQLGNPQQINPERINYAPSASVLSSIANLKGLADTGGYTEQGQQDIRARGI